MRYISIIFISLLISSSSCKSTHGNHTIPIKNNSNKQITVCLMGNGTDSIECVNLPYKIRNIGEPHDFIINETKNNLLEYYPEDWETYLSYSNHVKIFILVFDKDTFYNFPCDTFKKYKWYKKQELTLDYLDKNNWIITYP